MKENTLAQKFALLAPLHRDIFTCIRKDLRDEHLKQDRGFFKRNFPGKLLTALTVDDLLRVYPKFIADGFDSISEFVANRWLLRHIEIYNFFEKHLQQYSENFEEIDILEEPFAKGLLEEATGRFGHKSCYIFSVLNSVAFPETILKELQAHATSTT